MADIEKVNRLQLGPINSLGDAALAIREIQERLNQLIRVVNQLVVKVNGL